MNTDKVTKVAINTPPLGGRRGLWLAITAVLFVAYLVVATGFVNEKRQHINCCAIKITVCDSAINQFVNVRTVRQLIESDNTKLIGKPIEKINTRELEHKLNARSVVKNAEVFTSIDGVLHVRVYQRRPIVRVQTVNGSYYIDETGYLFPITTMYTSYVPIVTGSIPVSFKIGYRGEIPKEDKLLHQIYGFSTFLQDDDFWRSQIQQLYVQNAYDIEIVPRLGSQLIKMGSLENYEYKLEKLYAFYQRAMPQEGWDKYSRLDLRYSNQVVATLR